MRIIFDKYGKIVGTPTTDDYWGQGDDLTTYLEAQFLDDNDTPIVFSSNQYVECVCERPDGQISPALLMSKINDGQGNLTVAQLTVTNWITEVAGKLKFNVRLKETSGGTATTKVTGICYRVIGQAIDPADQTITDAQYQALMDALANKEDVENKSAILNQNSNVKYPTHKLLYEYIHDRIILITTEFANMASLESEFANGTAGIFNVSGLYSVKVGDGSNYDRVLVLVHARSGNYGYHATIFNGSFIEMLTGTIEESGPNAGHLSIPATQKRYDLSKIGFADNGTLSGLSTTNKNTLVAAINELYTFLGSTSGASLIGFDTETKDVVHCLNEAREMIGQIISGSLPVGSSINATNATNSTNATNDEDGNNIKSTYQTKSDFNDYKSDIQDGTIIVKKAEKDSQGNTIATFYGHSLSIMSDPETFEYVFLLKDASNNVISSTSIDLPIESVVVDGRFDSTTQKLILELENENTIEIPIGSLISGLQTEITSQNKLESDLVDDTGQDNKFVTSSEKTTISNAASHIANTSNPHSVTKAQVGLGNVDNTSDENKPISSATQTALNGKQATLKVFTNVSASTWVSDNTYEDYEYKCVLSCSGITSSSIVSVIFDTPEATSGNYAPVCESGTDTVTIWSKVNTTITIPVIKEV